MVSGLCKQKETIINICDSILKNNEHFIFNVIISEKNVCVGREGFNPRLYENIGVDPALSWDCHTCTNYT